MGRKGMPETVARCRFAQSGVADGVLHCVLQKAFGQMMPALAARTRINRQSRRSKNILPAPFAVGVRILSLQRKRQKDTPKSILQILVVLRFRLGQMSLEWLRQIDRKHRSAVF